MEIHALSFGKLPEEIRTKLTELQRPSNDRFVFVGKPSVLNYVAVAAGIGWIAYLFVATADYLWEGWMFWIFAAITLIIVPLAIWSASNVIAAFTGTTRDGYVFTHDECISYRGDRIGFRSLRELESFQPLEHIKTIEVWIGEEVEKIKAWNYDDATRLGDVFDEWRNASGETFLKPYATEEFAYSPASGHLKTVAVIVGSVVLAAALSYGAKVMNRNYDDEQSWKRAEPGQTVADFVAYKERHPKGSHSADADRRIGEIIGKAKIDYGRSQKANVNPDAAAALNAVFDDIATSPDRKIYVRYTEDRQLDDEVVKQLKSQSKLSISSYDFTIPTTALEYRREKILNDIGVLFLPATRNASIEFVASDEPPAGAPQIAVRNVMKSIPMYYVYYWASSSGSITTYYNPGARFEIDFELRPGNGSPSFKTQYVSNFTKGLNTGVVDSRDAANYSFDKVFFGSVSEDLAKFLQREFGFVD